MDWENKFHSIVKETEENLAKAKEKLSGKVSAQPDNHFEGLTPPSSKTVISTVLPPPSSMPYSKHHSQFTSAVPDYLKDSSLNMSGASGLQVLHMQEQIDSQNRTIERLQKLLRSLDSEREFYKEQISSLKGDVDTLTEKMSSHLMLTNSERQMSSVKREVMREIDALKTMLQTHTQETRKRQSSLSPRLDAEIWTVKENLTDSLEHIRQELSLMNKRIDRMEATLATESYGGKVQDPVEHRLSQSYHTPRSGRLPRIHTPASSCLHDVNNVDIQQLKHTIASLNTKLDNVEKKIESSGPQGSFLYSALRNSHHNRRYQIPYVRTSISKDDGDSLSDLSDLSNLNNGIGDDDFDLLTYELRDGTTELPQEKSQRSIYKSSYKYSGPSKVEFDLSDLDLSDVDDIEIETDSLDLDN